jgi:hypothetical protein
MAGSASEEAARVTSSRAAFRACYGSAIVVDRLAHRWALVCVDPDTHQYPTTEVTRAFGHLISPTSGTPTPAGSAQQDLRDRADRACRTSAHVVVDRVSFAGWSTRCARCSPSQTHDRAACTWAARWRCGSALGPPGKRQPDRRRQRLSGQAGEPDQHMVGFDPCRHRCIGCWPWGRRRSM